MLEALSPRAILRLLHKAGFACLDLSSEDYGSGLVLGNGEVWLMELANAYASLARGGRWMPLRVLQGAAQGPLARPRRLMSQESAYLVTHILSDNQARAQAFGLDSPLYLPFPFSAKTGTTKDYRDNWAIGYTPRWTVVVWVGNFDGSLMQRVSGVSGAGPILHDAAMALYQRFPSGDFRVPQGIEQALICPDSGDLAGPNCPNQMLEVFNSRFLPQRPCQLKHENGEIISAREPLCVDFPKNGDIFRLDPQVPAASQVLHFHCNKKQEGARYRWFMDGTPITAQGYEGWWDPQSGEHWLKMQVLSQSQVLAESKVNFRVLP